MLYASVPFVLFVAFVVKMLFQNVVSTAGDEWFAAVVAIVGGDDVVAPCRFGAVDDDVAKRINRDDGAERIHEEPCVFGLA